MNTTTLNPDFVYPPVPLVPLSPSEETKRVIILDITNSIANARFREGFVVGFSAGMIVTALLFGGLRQYN